MDDGVTPSPPSASHSSRTIDSAFHTATLRLRALTPTLTFLPPSSDIDVYLQKREAFGGYTKTRPQNYIKRRQLVLQQKFAAFTDKVNESLLKEEAAASMTRGEDDVKIFFYSKRTNPPPQQLGPRMTRSVALRTLPARATIQHLS